MRWRWVTATIAAALLVTACSSGDSLTDAERVWCATADDERLDQIVEAARVIGVLDPASWSFAEAGIDPELVSADPSELDESLLEEYEEALAARWDEISSEEALGQYLDSEDGMRACRAAFEAR